MTLNRLTQMMLAALVTMCVSSCATREVVFVPEMVNPDGTPVVIVRVGRAKGTVWYPRNGEWIETDKSVELPEGWWLIPPQVGKEDE